MEYDRTSHKLWRKSLFFATTGTEFDMNDSVADKQTNIISVESTTFDQWNVQAASFGSTSFDHSIRLIFNEPGNCINPSVTQLVLH